MEGGAPGEGGTGEAPPRAFFHLRDQQRSGSGQDCYANGIVFWGQVWAWSSLFFSLFGGLEQEEVGGKIREQNYLDSKMYTIETY